MLSSHTLDELYRLIPVIPVTRLSLNIPFYSGISAGFPSPADDYIEDHLDLNEHLIKNPSATFFVRVEGTSMIGAGINPNDILIVDKSVNARHDDIVIAVINGEFTVKRLYQRQGLLKLLPANQDFPVLTIKEGDECIIWGVVVHVLHDLRS